MAREKNSFLWGTIKCKYYMEWDGISLTSSRSSPIDESQASGSSWIRREARQPKPSRGTSPGTAGEPAQESSEDAEDELCGAPLFVSNDSIHSG